MSFLTITYYFEVGKTYVDILENHIRKYQMNKKIYNTKDGFLLNPTLDITKGVMGIWLSIKVINHKDDNRSMESRWFQ